MSVTVKIKKNQVRKDPDIGKKNKDELRKPKKILKKVNRLG